MRYDSLIELPQALVTPAQRGEARFLMGVDGGATKTLAAVLDIAEQTVHVGRAGSSNPDSAGAQAATDALLAATDEALGRAQIERDDLGAAVLAIAGTDTGAVAARISAIASSSWIVVNDVVGAWATATAGDPGVAAISGTGSNVFGVGAAGPWRAGGWGHVLGDEGSGYWLALQSIRAALADRDRSGRRTALSEAAVSFFEVNTIEALASLVYSKPIAKVQIAAFATEVARIAHEGDAVACDVYRRAATELGRQVLAVIEQTGLTNDRFPVGLIGSAFKVGPLFVEPLAEIIHRRAPGAQVSVAGMAPVGGCLLLAARAAGCVECVDRVALKRLLDAAPAHERAFRE